MKWKWSGNMAENKNRFGLVVVGLLLGILMSSMDNTIVSTAMGTIVSDLGGLKQFAWVTAAYMVTSMAGMPIFGKLSDMYGRKRFFIFGLVVFLFGSILCGMAGSMTELSIYRAIQGIGGGALTPIAFTIVFDIFPPEKRGKMTGLFGAVFGISSIFGPLLGAYISDHLSWHWIFYINLPIGVISFLLVFLFYQESASHGRSRIDWWGAFTLVPAVVCLMFALELGGNRYAWDSSVILGLFASFFVLIIGFMMAERKATEPIISFEMFRRRLFAASSLAGIFYGMTFIVAVLYLPIFIQGVLGGSATQSGLILTPMMVGSVIAAQIGGFSVMKTSYRSVMLISALIMITGIYLLSTLTADASRLLVTVYMIITGMGVGFSFSVLGMSSIHGFDVTQRGSATATSSFVRTLGMTLGASIFGTLQRNLFETKMESIMSHMPQGAPATIDPNALLSPEARQFIPGPVLEKITSALATSITETFLWALIPAVLALFSVVLMSKERLVASSSPKPPLEPKTEV